MFDEAGRYATTWTIGDLSGWDTSNVTNMLGMFSDFTPKFVKRFAETGAAMTEGFKAYINEVKAGTYPSAEHTYEIDDEVIEKLY